MSNKAVSRWETGESFPDIGVLEALSEVLGIKIQDIVTGEVGDSNENIITEIVRAAKLQATAKRRKILKSGLFKTASLTPFQNKFTKCTFFVSIGTLVYILLITGIMIAGLIFEKPWFLGKEDLQGPILNTQYGIVFIVNMLTLVIEYVKTKDTGYNIHIGTYISVGIMHLMYMYSDILHQMSMPQEACRQFFSTLVVISLETVVIAVFCQNIKKQFIERQL